MVVKIETSWHKALQSEFAKDYFLTLTTKVKQAYLEEAIYPPPQKLFAAFDLCPFSQVKVVILGQDPYHGPRQAHGLAFSVESGVAIPPSLQNIYKEIESDIGQKSLTNGDLTSWAEQGVLLLNSTLTVRAGDAGSHQHLGWEVFTDEVIRKLSSQKTNLVFLLWGNFAIKKRSLIDESKHLVLTAPHPSPLSAHRGFLGCRHFSQCNDYLAKNQIRPIDW